MNTRPLGSLDIAKLRNPGDVTPEVVTRQFEIKPGRFVVKSADGSFNYYPITGISKLYDSTESKIVTLVTTLPILSEGYLCLTNKRVVKVTLDDVVRGRICKFRSLTKEEIDILYGRATARGVGNSPAGLVEGTDQEALLSEDEQGLSEIPWDEESSAADLALEEQVLSLFYTEDAQALRRIKDTSHTRQLVKDSAVQNTDQDS